MTSDESAKPHPAQRDRNPFDIAHRSQEEVAAEIAARLSAWKQARDRNSGPAPSPASRPPQTANTMVTPGVTPTAARGTMNRTSGAHAPSSHAFGQQRMPRFGEYAEERRAPDQRTLEPERRVPGQWTTDQGTPEQTPSVAASPSALHRAVPAAPSLGQPARGFPFRAGLRRAGQSIARTPLTEAAIPEAAVPAAAIPETAIPETAIPETAIPETVPEVPVREFATTQHIEIESSAEIETSHVDSAPADASAMDQIAIQPIVVEPRVDASVDAARAAKSISIPAPVIETWEDEEAAIAAAGIPRLEIPERVTVPMAGRHAARGGTGWAMTLGAILLFLGVTLPAALWQQPSDEATAVIAVPPPGSLAPAPAPDISAPNAPASGALVEMTASNEPAPVVTAPGPFSAISEQRMQHAFAPYDALRSLEDGREVVAAPINMPNAAGPAETVASDSTTRDFTSGDSAGDARNVFTAATFPPTARPFIPSADAPASSTANPAHVLVAPPGAAMKPAARLKPVASAAVPPATKVTKPATKPVAQKPKVVEPTPQGTPTVEQMFDQLIKTLSNGQPPNPAVQPDLPGTRR